MPDPAQLIAAALAHHKAGRLDQAAALYESILVESPDQPDALHYSAMIAIQRGEHGEAVARLERAARLASDQAVVHNDFGVALRLAGRPTEAAAAFERATRVAPNYAEAWHNLGLTRRAQGDLTGAAAALAEAIRLDPAQPLTHNARGVVLAALGDKAGARAALERALELQPDFPEALTNLGLSYHEASEHERAAPYLERAARLAPKRGDVWHNVGLVRWALADMPGAIAAFGQAVACDPGLAAAHNALGVARNAMGDIAGAEAAFARAVELAPGNAEALNNLGLAARVKGDRQGGADLVERALKLDPNLADGWFNRGTFLHEDGDFDAATAAWRKALSIDPRQRVTRSNLLLALHYEESLSGEALRQEATAAERYFSDPSLLWSEWANSRDPDRRLRIGYVSPDFREHSCAHFIAPLLAAHDPSAVEVFAYADVREPDAITARMRGMVANWRSIFGILDRPAAKQIYADGIDILVDLAGHTAKNRLKLFAMKPAPIQVSWLGYPGTTGLSTIDYRITDAIADPPGLTEAHYSERLLRLARPFLCYAAPDQSPAVVEAPALATGFVTFGSFNNAQKLTPGTIALWAGILRAVPGARLYLKSNWLAQAALVGRLKAAFAAHGVAPERLSFAGWTEPTEGHLAAYGQVDIALDPFPYNGTTTTLEALWMGVPVVTLAGARHAGRVGASLLAHAGLGELIADSPAAYVAIATALAGDRARLARYRQSLRAQLRGSAVMDARGFARDLEAAYRRMWRAWCG